MRSVEEAILHRITGKVPVRIDYITGVPHGPCPTEVFNALIDFEEDRLDPIMEDPSGLVVLKTTQNTVYVYGCYASWKRQEYQEPEQLAFA
jgi:hypothetical protein